LAFAAGSFDFIAGCFALAFAEGVAAGFALGFAFTAESAHLTADFSFFGNFPAGLRAGSFLLGIGTPDDPIRPAVAQYRPAGRPLSPIIPRMTLSLAAAPSPVSRSRSAHSARVLAEGVWHERPDGSLGFHPIHRHSML